MVHFYGGVRGNRGAATRLGSKLSGMSTFANGWTTGAEVELSHVDGEDVVRVYRTGGSNALGSRTLIAQWKGAEGPTMKDGTVDRVITPEGIPAEQTCWCGKHYTTAECDHAVSVDHLPRVVDPSGYYGFTEPNI
jgi:hypothetical protein